MQELVHLHVHSEYSLLDGYASIEPLLEEARRLGQKSLALTDHGAMYGSLPFYRAARARGIKPILGVEAYLSPVPLAQRRKGYRYAHLLLLAENLAGYRNLLRLTTIAHTDGYSTRPLIDHAALEQYNDGLIVTTGCLSGEIPQMLRAGQEQEAWERAAWYRDVFGDRFYGEVQEHGSADPAQRTVNQSVRHLCSQLGVPLVATNDAHYVTASDARRHDALLCIQTGAKLGDAKRMRFDSNEYYLKSGDEMALLFAEMPEAVRNTVAIAERCQVEIPFHQSGLPEFVVPSPFSDPAEYLESLVGAGIRQRYPVETDETLQRVRYELDIIQSKGFSSYFLIVWDYVEWSRRQGILCRARGSAAGSVVAYALGITTVDPLRYGLLFERFLNPGRQSMPDIDIDFPEDRRDEVMRYIVQRYGEDRVAQIATFATMGARGAIRDVGRVLDQGEAASELARKCPAKGSLEEAQDQSEDLRSTLQQDERARQVWELALAMEGKIRAFGVHAAAVIIGNAPLVEQVPLQKRERNAEDSWLVSQYGQSDVEELGLLKMDLLGMSNLTMFRMARDLIRERTGVDLDLEQLPLTGPEAERAFALLAGGETTGIFQMESDGMRRYLRELQPTCLEDLTAMVALYRPGPIDAIPAFIAAKHGMARPALLHPRLGQWLDETYGVIVYQDQVLQIAVELAGFTWLEVDAFRKAMGKKQLEVMAKYKEKFVAGCIKNDIPEDIARTLYDLIEPFSGYGFNKAHACAYAWVGYQTAYLKANYPDAFFAASLSVEAGDDSKVIGLARECRERGIALLPPDIKTSRLACHVEDKGVRLGLTMIRHFQRRIAEQIVAGREREGTPVLFAEWCLHLPDSIQQVALIEPLIHSGALACYGHPARILAGAASALQYAAQERKRRSSTQMSLFAGTEALQPGLPEQTAASPACVRQWEYDALGFTLSSHPLSDLQDAIAARTDDRVLFLDESWNDQTVTLGVVIQQLQVVRTHKQQSMAKLVLEDLTGSVDAIVFPAAYERLRERLLPQTPLIVLGKVQWNTRGHAVHIEHVDPLQQEVYPEAQRVRVVFTPDTDARLIEKAAHLHRVLARCPGETPVEWALPIHGSPTIAVVRLSFGVRWTMTLSRDIDAVAGLGNTQVLWE